MAIGKLIHLTFFDLFTSVRGAQYRRKNRIYRLVVKKKKKTTKNYTIILDQFYMPLKRALYTTRKCFRTRF